MTADRSITTELATNDLHHIWIRGIDLADEIMGKRSFAEVVFLLLVGRLPEPAEAEMTDAILVSLMEHGLTPSAIVARMTYSVAPEALQGAVSAGLLGAGSLVLGSMEECGRLLSDLTEEVNSGASVDAAIDRKVADYRANRRKLPGFGHIIHKEGDPRAKRLLELAKERGLAEEQIDLLERLADSARKPDGAALPLNVTGAVAAILLGFGVPWRLHRGFALISRTAGLVAHIDEEMSAPISSSLRRIVREGATNPPSAGGSDK